MLIRRFAAVAALLCAALLAVRPAPAASSAAVTTSAAGASSAAPDPDEVHVPVRLTDPAVAAWLARGDHVDLYAGAAGVPLEVVGHALRVVQIVAGSGSSVSSDGPLVVLAVPSDDAPSVVAVASADIIVVTLSPPFTPR